MDLTERLADDNEQVALEAFDEFYSLNIEQIELQAKSACIGINLGEMAAEDLVQEAFLAFWEIRKNLDATKNNSPEKGPIGYFVRILRRVALMAARRSKAGVNLKQKVSSNQNIDFVIHLWGSDLDPQTVEICQKGLERILASAKKWHRDAWSRHMISGLTYKEIALKMKLGKSTVAKAVRRLNDKLKLDSETRPCMGLDQETSHTTYSHSEK